MVHYGLTQCEGGGSVLEFIERCSPHCVWWQLVPLPQVDDAREEGVLVGVDATVVLLQLQMVATCCRLECWSKLYIINNYKVDQLGWHWLQVVQLD